MSDAGRPWCKSNTPVCGTGFSGASPDGRPGLEIAVILDNKDPPWVFIERRRHARKTEKNLSTDWCRIYQKL